MRRRTNIIFSSLTAVSLAAVSGISCGGGDSGPDPICMTLTSYVPSTGTFYSFATDIYPILMNTMPTNAGKTTPAGCSQDLICHGNPPMAIDASLSKTMPFLDPAATVRTSLLAASVNAPSMMRVVPGSVGNSFMAYKISGTAGISCVIGKCVPGAGVSDTTACGDPMPSNGPIADADRIKILDWIGQGAPD